jgi:ADP-ribose pyrophosphatase YjhB (NUDIX family)
VTHSPDRPLVAVSVVARLAGRLLLVRRARPPHAGYWALPGGKVRFGEALADAATREVLEETGITVNRLRQIDTVEVIEDGGHFVIVVFEGVALDDRPRAASDADTAIWAAPLEADALALTRETRRVLARFAPA